MNSPFNKSVLMWWQSLGPSTKFELLPYFEEADDYASRTVSSYLKKTSTADILWHMLNDNSGRAILARHEKLTDDILGHCIYPSGRTLLESQLSRNNERSL